MIKTFNSTGIKNVLEFDKIIYKKKEKPRTSIILNKERMFPLYQEQDQITHTPAIQKFTYPCLELPMSTCHRNCKTV